MLKKAIGLLAAVSMAITSAGTQLPVAAQSDENITQEISAGQTDTEKTADELEENEEAALSDADELEKIAIENCDPQYYKALKAKEQYEAELELAISRDYSSVEEMHKAQATKSADTEGETNRYTGMPLYHNSRFDGYKKVYGIDVSQWQYNIDWKKVRSDDIDYAIIRLGYRGYGAAGTLNLDPYFYQNMQNAAEAGIDIGIYFYTQAITTEEAKAEADFVLKYLRNYDIQLPVYFDIEGVDGDVGRLDSAGLSKKEKTELCKAFCDRMIDNGYEAGVYANKTWLTYMIDGDELAKQYPIWLAHYNTYTDYTGDYNTWQFSSIGTVKGISGGVDMNVDYRGKASSAPIAPTNVSASVANGKATITWNDPSNADKYVVYRVNDSDDTYSKIATVTARKYTVALTDEETAYCVRSVKTSGGVTLYSDYSECVYVSNRNSDRDAPARVVSTDYTSAVINFHAAEGAVSYKVTDTSQNKVLAELEENAAGTDQRINGLLPCRGTYLLIQAVKADDSIENIGILYVRTKQISAPTGVKVSGRSSDTTAYTTAKVSWNAVSGVHGYCVFQKKNGVEYFAKKTSKTADTIYSLKAGSDFEFVVKAYIEADGKLYFGDGSKASVIHCRPQTPNGITLTSVSNGIKVSFGRTEGADGYMVYRCDSSNGTYTRIAKLTGANKTAYTDTDTQVGNTYYYKIRAYRTSGGTSYYSEYTDPCSCTRQ